MIFLPSKLKTAILYFSLAMGSTPNGTEVAKLYQGERKDLMKIATNQNVNQKSLEGFRLA